MRDMTLTLTFGEIYDLETQVDAELRDECNALMQTGDAEKIDKGFQVQTARFELRNFVDRLYLFANEKHSGKMDTDYYEILETKTH